MEKDNANTKNDQTSTSSTYAGKAEKGDTSGRVGEARVPGRGEATGAPVDRESIGKEDAGNAGAQWDENAPGLTAKEREEKKSKKSPNAA